MDEQERSIEPASGPFTCTKCGEKKAAGAFYTKKDVPTGYRQPCKACIAFTRKTKRAPILSDGALLRCKVCKTEKLATEFPRNKQYKTGFGSICKTCWTDTHQHSSVSDDVLLKCSTCHQEKPASAFNRRGASEDGRHYRCRECESAYNTARYPLIRETRLAQEAAKRAANIEEARAEDKAFYARHREELAAKKREVRAEDPEKAHAMATAWREANPEKVRAYSNEHGRRRRARLALATHIEIFPDSEIFSRDKWICQICYKRVNKRYRFPHPMSASIDHVTPVTKGGPHTRQNVVLAHLRCNISKGNRSVIQQQRLF